MVTNLRSGRVGGVERLSRSCQAWVTNLIGEGIDGPVARPLHPFDTAHIHIGRHDTAKVQIAPGLHRCARE